MYPQHDVSVALRTLVPANALCSIIPRPVSKRLFSQFVRQVDVLQASRGGPHSCFPKYCFMAISHRSERQTRQQRPSDVLFELCPEIQTVGFFYQSVKSHTLPIWLLQSCCSVSAVRWWSVCIVVKGGGHEHVQLPFIFDISRSCRTLLSFYWISLLLIFVFRYRQTRI